MGRVFGFVCLVAQMFRGPYIVLIDGPDDAGFPLSLFGGTDITDRAPTNPISSYSQLTDFIANNPSLHK
jgi:hypothetical protein